MRISYKIVTNVSWYLATPSSSSFEKLWAKIHSCESTNLSCSWPGAATTDEAAPRHSCPPPPQEQHPPWFFFRIKFQNLWLPSAPRESCRTASRRPSCRRAWRRRRGLAPSSQTGRRWQSGSRGSAPELVSRENSLLCQDLGEQEDDVCNILQSSVGHQEEDQT